MQTRHVQPGGCGVLESGPGAKKRSATITANAGNREVIERMPGTILDGRTQRVSGNLSENHELRSQRNAVEDQPKPGCDPGTEQNQSRDHS